MKNKIVVFIMIINIMATQNVFSIKPPSTTISYPTYKDAPGYNTPMPDSKFNGIEPITFTPYEDIVTGDDSNKDEIGYFWDIKNPDKALLYPGVARIGNSQYINVVAVNSKNVNTTGNNDSVVSTGSDNIYQPSVTQQKQFDDSYLVPIGTFMKKNDPTIYVLYGMYQYTVFPDPRVVAVTGGIARNTPNDPMTAVVGATPDMLEQ
ncbi:MAG: hypothetical protein JO129_02335 [Candidatus Dependentiae bacterium]|nr:hypothetical protein [Candidatus Dependentiae bacterium]